MKQKVVIIGKGYNNRLALLRSLGEYGYEISIIVLEHIKKPIDSYSKYVTNYYWCPKQTEEDLISVLMTNCVDEKQKVILIPSEDFSVYVLDKNLDKLKKYFIFPNIYGKQGAIISWMDKEKQKKLAKTLGLYVAESNSIRIENGKFAIPSTIKYPCFIKPQSFVLNSKDLLYKCSNEKELKKTLHSICNKQNDIDLMIEEYKQIDREYAVVGFSNNKEIIIPGVIEILSITKGIANTGRIVPVDDYKDIIIKIKQFILKIGFVGIFDVDFYLCSGKYFFGEINFRYGGSGFAFCKRGINYPLMLVKTMLGDTSDNMKKEINSPLTFANEQRCLVDWYCGNITSKEFWKVINDSDIVNIIDENDSVPYTLLKKHIEKLRIKRLLRKLVFYVIKRN